jgi:hypothetical protein
MYIAVDPGKMCGLAACFDDGSYAFSMDAPPYETVNWVVEKIATNFAKIIVERYMITPATIKMTREYDALETIGALRYVARRKGIKIELQSRGDRLRVTNAQLKRLGWYTQTSGGHANDAARHLWLGFMRSNPDHDLVKQMLDTI